MTVENPTSRVAAQEENVRLARAIDQTKLTFAPGEDETEAIVRLCDEARLHRFYAVCVRPRHVSLAKETLAGSPVRVATVIGFPPEKVRLADERRQPTVGAASTAEKLAEARQALENGADELDWVVHVAALKADVAVDGRRVWEELAAARAVADGKPIKVIIETDLLTPAEIEQAAAWCAETGLAMVKTSTGMVEGGQGATLANVALIAKTLQCLNASTEIKASGSIKTRAQALAFLDAGAVRIGTSSGVAIVQGAPSDGLLPSDVNSAY